MYPQPNRKYRSFQPLRLSDRGWPAHTISRAPVWLSTDLRDGNQALMEPMNAGRKLRLWETLVRVGFKEIEIGFPSASQTDFDFVRRLIEERRIPDDATVQVLTPAREELIGRSFEALRGAPRACVHLYTATAPVFRRVVLGKSRAQVRDMAVQSMALMRRLAAEQPATEWRFEYSPETFSATELEYAREICDAVSEVAAPTPERKLIINLPATVEVATPNVFADQVEWMHRNLARRDSILISVHPHNDRGTGVAAAELALMAGAERVEGCLFGNGERTGNVCLVTLAMNLYTQGVSPGLDFSDIDAVRRCAEDCTGLPVHPRHPYAGELVYTAFSGSHQDAIRKGLLAQDPRVRWEVPYLPVDPADVGRSYQAVIRVNSQSGKAGIAYLLERGYGIELPRRLQMELRDAVQAVADATGEELEAEDIYAVLQREYVAPAGPYRYVCHVLDEDTSASERVRITVEMAQDGRLQRLTGEGNGPIDAFVAAIDAEVSVRDYHEHAIGEGASAQAAAYVELRDASGRGHWGVGQDANIVTASLKAIVSALNRAAVAAEPVPARVRVASA